MQKEIRQNSRILIIRILISRTLISNDEPENVALLEGVLRQGGYKHLKSVTDFRDALTVFSEFDPDLVVLDEIALLSQIQSRVPEGAFLPVLILTSDLSRGARHAALSMGAKDFLTKPLDATEVLPRVYNLLETRWLRLELQRHTKTLEGKVQERTRELEEAQLEILQRLALAAEYRDDCTGQHAQRVGHLAALLGQSIGLAEDRLALIRRAAPLHDVGNIGIPDGILLKPGRLTPEEYRRIKTHTDIGRIILSGSKFPILKMAERIALYHHEHWDGSGYYGLMGKEIPLEARIVGIVDAFDVITHERPYKAAASLEEAMEAIREERGKQFDPSLVDAFLPLQSLVDLVKLGEALDLEAGPRLEAGSSVLSQ